MSNNSNRMIVFASILGAILATGLLALNPSTITNAGAQMYGDQYGYDSNYYQDDNRYGYDKNHQKKSSHTDIQKIKCVNSNINVNGVDITQIPQDDTATTAAANEGAAAADAANSQNGNGFDKINFDRNLVNICVNVNHNEQVKITPPPTDGNEPPTTCEGCFADLTPEQIDDIFPMMFAGGVSFETLQDLCEFLDGDLTDQQREDIYLVISTGLIDSDLSNTEVTAILDCLEGLGLIIS